MKIHHHGAKAGVTGSCHQLDTEWGSLLVDCGLFQGKEERPLEVDFSVNGINALILTHAHIDHIGRLPWLLAAGFTSPIYCTEATAALVPLMLDDGLRLQLGLDSRQRRRVLELIQRLTVPVEYGMWQNVAPAGKEGLLIRFQPAGHILGSAYVEVKAPDNRVVVFSGDLGPANTPLLPDPVSPERADIVVLESTYGDKNHSSVESRAGQLKAMVEKSLDDGGAILIPAFSVGRTQELLFDLENIVANVFNETERKDWSRLPVILDSPLALEVTKQYRDFKTLWGKEAKVRLTKGRHPLAFEQCVTIENHRDHLALVNRLKQSGEPALVVAASGMCNGGRILNYLKALLPDACTDVILAGYQAEGTLGRELQQGRKGVNIENEEISVNANIHTLSGYSAHAGKDELVTFACNIDHPPKEIRLVHGERTSQESLARELRSRLPNTMVSLASDL
ncbi:MBL fold metallo-hydrolase [Parasalinivibrio latis]|uniref:MBL fold metallo-hydrolase n=1 Tax=Parasalinivibrio latis TaxID=2952610 RepID=UPI0030DF7681